MPRLVVVVGLGVAAITLGISRLGDVMPLALAQPQVRSPSHKPAPSCLDKSIRDELGRRLQPRGVQRRLFAKQGRFEFLARGGIFAADLLSSSYIVGGAASYWLTEDLGVELSFDMTPIKLRLDDPLQEFFRDDRFDHAGRGYLGLASMMWAPIHAKLKLGRRIVHSDILFVVGAGRLIHETVQGLTFDAGASLELYATDIITARFDLRDVIAIQEAVTQTRLTHNIVASVGVGFWIPSR